MKRCLALLAASGLVLLGCSQDPDRGLADTAPRPIAIVDTSDTWRDARLLPVTLPDGTRCVVIANVHGTGIDCQWETGADDRPDPQ